MAAGNSWKSVTVCEQRGQQRLYLESQSGARWGGLRWRNILGPMINKRDYNIETAASHNLNILEGHFKNVLVFSFFYFPFGLIDTGELIATLGGSSVKCSHFMIP